MMGVVANTLQILNRKVMCCLENITVNQTHVYAVKCNVNLSFQTLQQKLVLSMMTPPITSFKACCYLTYLPSVL